MSKIVGRTVKKSDDGVSSDIGQPVLAAVLRSLKPGESVDVYTETPPTPVTQTAQELGSKPQNFYEHGVGPGRTEPGIPQYVTKLEQEPLGVPGYGKSTLGQSTTTSRASTLAVESDYRVGGNDEGGTMTFGPTEQPAATNPKPSPDKDTDAGGPIRKGARRDG
jgi:hypothetical protein